MCDLTVIYYTGNYERPGLLQRVQETLVQNMGDTPLISVSQVPMDLGHNVCVGAQQISTQNTYRQFLIGALEARTKWVCTAEDDCLYPPEYFQYRPPTDTDMYCALPMWALYARSRTMRCFIPKKYGSFGAAIMGREKAIEAFERLLKPYGRWGCIDERDMSHIDVYLPRTTCTLSQPVVSIKTDQALHRRTPMYPGICQEVPYWGTVEEVIERYVA